MAKIMADQLRDRGYSRRPEESRWALREPRGRAEGSLQEPGSSPVTFYWRVGSRDPPPTHTHTQNRAAVFSLGEVVAAAENQKILKRK